MTVAGAPRRSKRPSTRPRLLHGMTEAAARHGYAHATVARVLTLSGASRSTFYECFADSDECFLAAAEVISDRLQAAVEERVAGQTHQRLPFVAAETLLDFAEDEEAQARLLFTELLAGGSRALDLRDALIDNIARIIEDGWCRSAGETPTCDLPAQALVGGIFRSLAFALRESELRDLRPALLAWIDAYFVADAAAWQTASALEGLSPYAGAPVEPILPPPPMPRGRPMRPAEETVQIQRARLLHATAASVYTKGYAAVSVTDIVNRAQVSRGVFYDQFPNKQTAAYWAAQLGFEIGITSFAEAFFATSDWPTGIWDGAQALTQACRAAPALTYLAYVEADALGAETKWVFSGRVLTFTVLLHAGFRHRTDGPALPRLTPQVLACATLELLYREQPHHFARLLPQLAYMNLAPFLGAHAATRLVQKRMSDLTGPDR